MIETTSKRYDVFISHASEDKALVAMPLVDHLQRQGLKIWIDEFELTIGDSLRRSIDNGLAQSRFGIVIVSPAFFKKVWTNRELSALVAREDGNEKIILPIWHNLNREQVLTFSPILANKLAISTNQGIEYVATEVIRAITRENKNTTVQFYFQLMEKRKIEELSKVRSSMLTANSFRELQKVLFKAEEFLSRYPNDSNGRLLKEHVVMAIKVEMLAWLILLGRRILIVVTLLLTTGVLVSLLIQLIKWVFEIIK